METAFLQVTGTSLSVVITKLGEEKAISCYFVNYSVLRGNASGPVALQSMFKRFRFADAGVGCSLYFPDQLVDST